MLDTIYRILQDLANKNDSGGTYSPEEFEKFAIKNNLQKYMDKYREFEQSQTITDSFRRFKETSVGITLTAGVGDLPTDYKHLMVAINGDYYIDEVNEIEWVKRINSSITLPSEEYPICKIYETNIQVKPNSITGIKISYLRLPVDPYYDYYITANGKVTYLEVGEEYTLTTGEVSRSGATSGTITSASVELEWDYDDQIDIMMRIAQDYGISIMRGDLVQYGIAMENKNQQLS